MSAGSIRTVAACDLSMDKQNEENYGAINSFCAIWNQAIG